MQPTLADFIDTAATLVTKATNLVSIPSDSRHNGGMADYLLPRLWVGLLSFWLCCALPAHGDTLPVDAIAEPTVFNLAQQESLPLQQALQRWQKTDILYLGETHDRPADHMAQLQIIQMLHQQRNLVIAMEMFQRPYQAVLNRFLQGELSEMELLARSEYKKRWGYDWEFYAPIVRFAKAESLPVIALNTPTEVTRKVARQGLSSLTWPDRRFVPPLSAIALGPERYRQRLRDIFIEIHQGKTSSLNFDYFFQAQVLWDETMAERIAQLRQQHPQSLIVVLVGQGHLFYGEGVPQRVSRRQPATRQVSVLLNPAEEIRTALPEISDYFWFTP